MRSKRSTRPVTVAANPWRSRRLPRFAADLRVRIAIASSPRPRIIHARTADLSSGGFALVLPQDVADETLALIGFRLPRTELPTGFEPVLWFRACLRHRAGFRCGFEFVDLSVEQRLLLRRLCLSLPR